jgi:hypothetical protein
VRQWHPPGPVLEKVPGFWRWEEGWPIARIKEKPFYPQPNHTLSTSAPRGTEHRLRYMPTIGLEAGGPVMWWGDAAHDQRSTDAFSLVYDSDPLEQETEILGLPKAVLNVAADKPHANWFVRISDVAPDGTVTQVAGAGFNGTHRISAREPRALEPGKFFPLEIEMHFSSWVFPKGHRIRFAVNNAQWPMLWPTRYAPMTTSLKLGGKDGSHVLLPIVPPGKRAAPDFLPPAAAPPALAGFESLEEGTTSGYGEISSVDRNPQTGEVKVTATNTGASRKPWGTETYRETIEHRTSDAHPENTTVIGHASPGDHARGSRAAVGGGALVHQRFRELPLQVHAPLVRERQETSREDLDGNHPARFPVTRLFLPALDAHDLAAVALVRPAFGARAAHLGQAMLFAQLRAALDALRRLLVVRLCLGSRPPPRRHAHDVELRVRPADHDAQPIPNAHVMRRLHALAVHVHLAAAHSLRRQRPSLEETRKPQPFVDAVAIRFRCVCHGTSFRIHSGGSGTWSGF